MSLSRTDERCQLLSTIPQSDTSLEPFKLQPQSHMRVITAPEYEEGTLPLLRQWDTFLVRKVMGRCGKLGTGTSVMEAFIVYWLITDVAVVIVILCCVVHSS